MVVVEVLQVLQVLQDGMVKKVLRVEVLQEVLLQTQVVQEVLL